MRALQTLYLRTSLNLFSCLTTRIQKFLKTKKQYKKKIHFFKIFLTKSK